jgi:hypothetical protein
MLMKMTTYYHSRMTAPLVASPDAVGPHIAPFQQEVAKMRCFVPFSKGS